MEPKLTPAQKTLMDFLNKLASTPYSPALMDEGYQALDKAVEESQRLQDSITDASKAISRVRGGRLMDELKQSFQQQLESVGVPVNLAFQCAEILVKDDPSKEDLGRTPEELHLVQSAYSWMTAKQD